ncbi:hypothetical protein PP707_07785, partial [Acetobacter pasteurianus]|nr:hypothetical protein [Acetobacter pasteurianus]
FFLREPIVYIVFIAEFSPTFLLKFIYSSRGAGQSVLRHKGNKERDRRLVVLFGEKKITT